MSPETAIPGYWLLLELLSGVMYGNLPSRSLPALLSPALLLSPLSPAYEPSPRPKPLSSEVPTFVPH